MIEAAAITLRESVEAILVIFIMVAYLEKTSSSHKKKFVYGGAITAVITSILLALVLTQLGINPENELAEGILFFVAGFLVLSLTLWMIRHAKHFKTEIEDKMKKAGSTAALFGIAFIMVAREGVETVIFFQSLMLSGTQPVAGFIGGLTGILLALLFGAVFLKGTARINLKRFFSITSIILFVLAIELFANGFHEFFEVQLLPSSRTLLAIVGFLAKKSTGAAIIAITLFALAGTVLYDLIQTTPPDNDHLPSAEKRKARYNFLKEKYGKIGLISVVTLSTLVILAPSFTGSDIQVPKAQTVHSSQGTVKISKPDQNGLHKYRFKGQRFIVAIEKGKAHVARDYCSICPKTGYGYDGDKLICLNCGAPIKISTVGIPGGCNPQPLDHEIKGDSVSIAVNEFHIPGE